MSSDSPALKAKFDDPNYLEEGEQMFKDKFSENLQVNLFNEKGWLLIIVYS